MHNPFTVIRAAVSRLFAPKPVPAPAVEYKAPDAPKVARMALPEERPYLPGYVPSQSARNARRKERAKVRAFVLALNRAR